MGMDISSKLMVGLSYKHLCEKVDKEMLDELLDDGDLDYASPHYDSPRQLWFVGLDLCNGIPVVDNVVISAKEMKEIADDLDNLLGTKLTYVLRGCAHVS